MKAITVRLVRDDYDRLQGYADARNTSLNAVVAEAIVEYGRKVERRDALTRIESLRGQMDPANTTSDSVALIRELRAERVAHLAGETTPGGRADPPGPAKPAGPPREGSGKP